MRMALRLLLLLLVTSAAARIQFLAFYGCFFAVVFILTADIYTGLEMKDADGNRMNISPPDVPPKLWLKWYLPCCKLVAWTGHGHTVGMDGV